MNGGNSSVSRAASADRVVIDHLALGIRYTRLEGTRVDTALVRDVAGLGVQAVIVAYATSFRWDDHLWWSRATRRRPLRRDRHKRPRQDE